jgi:hypothetical protein
MRGQNILGLDLFLPGLYPVLPVFPGFGNRLPEKGALSCLHFLYFSKKTCNPAVSCYNQTIYLYTGLES